MNSVSKTVGSPTYRAEENGSNSSGCYKSRVRRIFDLGSGESFR